MSNQPPTTDFIAEFWNEFHRQAVRNQLANASTTEVNKMNAADAIKHSRRHARVNAAINNIRSHIMDAITSGEPSMKITCSTDWPAWLNAELTKNDFETIGETFNAEGYQVTIIEGEHITIVWDNDTLATTTGFTDEQPSASDVAGFIGQSSPPVKMFVDQIEDRMRESTQADSGPFFISYTAVSDHIKAEDGIKAVIKEIESRGFEADDDTSAQMIVVRKLSGELAHARAMLDTGKIDTSHKPDSVATVHSDGSFDLTPINENIVNRAVNAVRAAARAGELGIEQLKQAANASGLIVTGPIRGGQHDPAPVAHHTRIITASEAAEIADRVMTTEQIMARVMVLINSASLKKKTCIRDFTKMLDGHEREIVIEQLVKHGYRFDGEDLVWTHANKKPAA